MYTFPAEYKQLISIFRPAFARKKTFNRACLLLFGGLLTFGPRTVCNVLRFLGRSQADDFSLFHQLLSRCRWSARCAAKVLLRQMLKQWSQQVLQRTHGRLVFSIDEHIERRWGKRIKARGIYRDAVRSSKSTFVKSSGLRWICMSWIGGPAWLARLWALPFLTVLAPSKGYSETYRKGRHKKLTQWARQMVYQVRRWTGTLPLVFLGDEVYSAKNLLSAIPLQCCWITPLRWNAVLHDLPSPEQREDAKRGNRQMKLSERLNHPDTLWEEVFIRNWYDTKGKGRKMLVATGTALWYSPCQPMVHLRWVIVKDLEGEYEPRCLLCTDIALCAQLIVEFFVWRWPIEVTFAEARRHLGVETQRQWSDLAILRTTPVLLAGISMVTLWADLLVQDQGPELLHTAWYHKQQPTFADALAQVRRSVFVTLAFKSKENKDLKASNSTQANIRVQPLASVA